MDTLSTTIDTELGPTDVGGGQVPIAEPEVNSLRADIEAALKETAEPEPKAEPEKVEKEEKPDKAPETEKIEEKAEPEKQPETDGAKDEADEKPEAEQKEAEPKGKHPEAPAKFLPRAKELWRNTPNEVKAEVDRVLREAEESTAAYKRYDDFREFDELAKSNGRDLRESLHKMSQIEDLLQSNPIAGLNAILMEVGPRKSDGQAVSLFEVANFIVNQGQQGYQQMVAQPAPQRQADPEVQNLRAEIADLKVQQASRDIIEPFAAKHPRYNELQGDIAFFLQSGKIPAGLSPSDRLAAAYDMAVRINPSSTVPPATKDEPPTERRADSGFDGSAKSIKSSPGSVTEEVEDRGEGGESIRDSILKASRRLR